MRMIVGYIAIIGMLRFFVFNEKYKKIFILIAGLLLFVLAALRSIEFGPDVMGYVKTYESLNHTDLSTLIKNLFSKNEKDPFFYVVSKLISMTGAGYELWIAIISGFFTFSIVEVIKKYSPYPFISFIALISLGYFYFSLTGLRQTLGLSMVLLSYTPLRERKLLPFVVLVTIGGLFHSSALIFLFSYPLMNMKLGIKNIVGTGFAVFASVFFGNYVRRLVIIFGWTDTMANYAFREAALSYSGFIIQLLIFMFCMLYKNKVIENNKNDLSLYNLLFIGLLFQAFASVIAEFFRISMYFSIFSIVLIPKVIATEKNNYLRILTYLIIFSALTAYIVWTNSFDDFKFLWN